MVTEDVDVLESDCVSPDVLESDCVLPDVLESDCGLPDVLERDCVLPFVLWTLQNVWQHPQTRRRIPQERNYWSLARIVTTCTYGPPPVNECLRRCRLSVR
jgi:hypothetical protein